MRTLLLILALLMAGNSYGKTTYYRDCQGINQTANFKELASMTTQWGGNPANTKPKIKIK